MQTHISPEILATARGQEADRILRACVHCGFCTATCPTYQLLGDELDGPRGRIYLIKQLLEGNEVSVQTQRHLDRCLTCRSCETTCPSGVRYGRLVDIGRELVERRVGRNPLAAVLRFLLRKIVPYPQRIAVLFWLGRMMRPLLPVSLQQKIPPAQKPAQFAQQVRLQNPRRMLIMQGCVQGVATPATNRAVHNVLNKLGIELLEAPSAGCCGAVSHHLAATDEALDFARRNIDAWWPYIEQGVDTIISSASGCGVMVKDYGSLLAHDPVYAERAHKISQLTRDVSEVLARERLSRDRFNPDARRVAFHNPCTLQHGQHVQGVVEAILEKAGFQLLEVADAHLCCGSAGTYSLLQPSLAQQLLENKLTSLQRPRPEVIATANVGCQLHLASQASVPVKHWIELINEVLC